jgi:transcriptional regulator with XRE-family HTH domain
MNDTVGEKLRTLRQAAKLSQSELANKLYFSNRTISSWENNSREISFENLKKIANFFNVGIDFFSDQTPAKFPTNSKQTFQEIKYRMVNLDDRYFYILLGSILINILLYLYPFQNLFNVSLIFFFYWTGFLIQSLTRFMMLSRTQTKKFLVPIGFNVFFLTVLNSLQRKKHQVINLFAYSFLIILTTLFYLGILYLIENVNPNIFLTTMMMTFLIFSNLYHVYLLVRYSLKGVPKQSEPYVKDKVDVQMNFHRVTITIHYVYMIILILLMGSFGFDSFPTNFTLLMLFMGSMLFLLLRMVFYVNVKFYGSYQLIVKDSESLTEQKLF